MGKCENWKKALLEQKGLLKTVRKTKGMELLDGKRRVTAKINPCEVCGERVDCNSIKCTKCKKWAPRRCSGVSHEVSLTAVCDVFVCRYCLRLLAAEVQIPVFKCGDENILY